MLALHEWFRAFGYHASDHFWAAPAYAAIILAPLTFNVLRGEFSWRRSLAGALVATSPFVATAAWFCWSSLAIVEAPPVLAPDVAGFLMFCLASLVAWFIILPFVQSRLRDGTMAFQYARLFDDAWRNALLLANCILFAALFWMLLGLWGRAGAAGAAGLKRSASHLRITASPTPDAPRPRPAVHTHGLRRPRSTRIGSEGAATDAPANPNTPGTTRQDRDSGAFARAAAEPASASTFDGITIQRGFFDHGFFYPRHAPAFLATRGPGARKLRWIVIPDPSSRQGCRARHGARARRRCGSHAQGRIRNRDTASAART